MFAFFIGRPFTSTAYPKGREKMFAKALEGGYLDRVSISASNVARLFKDGWVRHGKNSEGQEILVSDNPALQKILDEESTYIDPEMLTRLRIGRFYDESRKGVEEAPTGGLERENVVILRTDEFCNLVICEPTQEFRGGIIVRKINPEKINQPIDLSHLPETIDELMDYGIVNQHEKESIFYHEAYGRVKSFSLILSNFSGNKENRFYVEYNLQDHKIISTVEIRDNEKAEFDFFTDINKQKSQMEEMMKGGMNFSYLMMGVAPSRVKLEELKKDSQFYKKALELLKPVFDKFKKIGGEINFENHPFSVYVKGFAGEDDGEQNRKDILEDLIALNNVFILMREIYSDVSDKDLQKSKNDAFNKFFQGIRNTLSQYTKGGILAESLEFIESLRKKYIGE